MYVAGVNTGLKMIKKPVIVPDTNFLVYLAKNRAFDKLDELGFEIHVLRIVDYELEKISMDKIKQEDRQAASLAQEIIKKWVAMKKAKYIDVAEDKADDAIVAYAVKKNAAVATMDKALVARLKAKNLKVFCIRQNKYIEEY